MTDHPRLEFNFDAFLPPEMAQRAELAGEAKVAMPMGKMFALAVLAGAFIAQGAIFATIVTTGAAGIMPFGVTRLLAGLVFSLGLVLVVVAGAELFTGNNLIVMALAARRVTWKSLLRNWAIVYTGNFVGAVATAVLMLFARHYMLADTALGQNMLNIAQAKCRLGFTQAIALGIACNALVCIAVWLCFSARSTTDKVLAIIFPITAFVAAGFEHCVANMYFVPMGLFVKSSAPEFWETSSLSVESFTDLTWTTFLLHNLLPVTIGNILGGSLLVGVMYWYIYLRDKNSQ